RDDLGADARGRHLPVLLLFRRQCDATGPSQRVVGRRHTRLGRSGPDQVRPCRLGADGTAAVPTSGNARLPPGGTGRWLTELPPSPVSHPGRGWPNPTPSSWSRG